MLASYRVPSPNCAVMLPDTSTAIWMLVSDRFCCGGPFRCGPASTHTATASKSGGRDSARVTRAHRIHPPRARARSSGSTTRRVGRSQRFAHTHASSSTGTASANSTAGYANCGQVSGISR